MSWPSRGSQGDHAPYPPLQSTSMPLLPMLLLLLMLLPLLVLLLLPLVEGLELEGIRLAPLLLGRGAGVTVSPPSAVAHTEVRKDGVCQCMGWQERWACTKDTRFVVNRYHLFQFSSCAAFVNALCLCLARAKKRRHQLTGLVRQHYKCRTLNCQP